jgi:hypothetical protein
LDLFMFFFSSIKCPIWSSFFYEWNDRNIALNF